MLLSSIILAIVNATLPIGDQQVDIPVSVTPVGALASQSAPQTATPQQIAGGIDFAGLTGLITAISGILGGLGFKLYKDGKRDDTRANLNADTQLKMVKSLQETDKADYIFKGALVDYITHPADETKKERLIQLSKESHDNYISYYGNIDPVPSDYSKDEVVKKLSAVQKRTTPS